MLYDAKEARSHIERKYNYIRKRISSTEQFIRYAATESSMSGRKYHAVCNGNTITSQEWLTRELKRYRQQNTTEKQ